MEPESISNQFIKITEQNSIHENLDKKSIHDLLLEMNEEDRKVPEAVAQAIPQVEMLVENIVKRMKRGGRIFYLGAGTSGRLGVLDASDIPPTFGMPAHAVVGLIAGGELALRKAVEHAEDNSDRGWEELIERNVTKFDTIIGIAASGTTPYVVGTLRKARENGILTASISCNPNSPIAEEAEIKIDVVVGPEFITGSTRLKSGTAQKLVLNMITTTVMIKLGRINGNKMVNMQLNNLKLMDRGIRIIMEELGIVHEQATNILLIHGSVKKAIDAYKKERM